MGRPLATIAILVAVWGPAVARGDDDPLASFKAAVRQIGQNWVADAMWVDLLDHVALACNLEVDRRRVMLLTSLMPGSIQGPLDTLRSGRMRNDMAEDWERLKDGDFTGSCHLATGLWGNSGAQFTGVLLER